MAKNRRIIRVFSALVFGVRLCLPAAGAEEESPDEKHLEKLAQKDEVDKAVEKGLAYLAKQQDMKTGKFNGPLPNTMTGLACMALMAAGHFPGRSQYGENLRLGIKFLVEAAKKEKGYFGKGGGRMYGHGICTLALAEAYGMMQKEQENKQVREALDLAIKVVLKAQCQQKNQHFGGWRYNPRNNDSDLSVSAWQILALRAAQNCKLKVPKKVIDDAVTYLRRVYNPRDKAFTYNGGNASSAMRAAGVVCMLALGANKTEADRVKINHSASFLLGFNPASGGYFYYQSYYIGTAANMMGGKYREQALPKLEKVLVRLQQGDGSFSKHQGYHGGVYSTAFAVICLSIRYQFLPIYQE